MKAFQRMALIDNQIAQLEAISKQRDFTDEEIVRFSNLIRRKRISEAYQRRSLEKARQAVAVYLGTGA